VLCLRLCAACQKALKSSHMSVVGMPVSFVELNTHEQVDPVDL
jgi:hypothetical protein